MYFCSEGNTSIATHTFGVAGSFQVTVKVSNHLQSKPVIARLPQPVIVQHPVTGVKVQAKTTVTGNLGVLAGAHFKPHENRSDKVVFEAT
jgi:hypothetical protein